MTGYILYTATIAGLCWTMVQPALAVLYAF